MDDNQLRKLEKNLTKSAKKAKMYWVRGMVGFTEADQGFFPIEAIPVLNPIQGKYTTLAELIEDCGNLNNNHKQLRLDYESLEKNIIYYNADQIELQQQNQKQMDALAQRIAAIEAFKID